jgi:hypothetical protein
LQRTAVPVTSWWTRAGRAVAIGLAVILVSIMVVVGLDAQRDADERDRRMAVLRADLAGVSPPPGARWLPGESSASCFEDSGGGQIGPFARLEADDGSGRKGGGGVAPAPALATFDHASYVLLVDAELEEAGIVAEQSSDTHDRIYLSWSRGSGEDRREIHLLTYPRGAQLTSIFDAAVCG